MSLFNKKESFKNKKSMVIYFSRADENYAVGYITKGNTEIIAEYIRDITGADLFKVEPSIPYSKEYQPCIEEAEERQATHNAPILKNVPDISKYEVIYIGSPIYWNVMPEEMVTALKNIDFTGKTIRVVTTHEGSGLGNVVNDVKRICKGANVVDSIAIRGSECKNARGRIENWV